MTKFPPEMEVSIISLHSSFTIRDVKSSRNHIIIKHHKIVSAGSSPGRLVGWGRSGGVGSGVAVPSLGLWGVDGGSLVGHLGDETVIVVGGVLRGLDTTVGKSDGEGSGNVSTGVLAF